MPIPGWAKNPKTIQKLERAKKAKLQEWANVSLPWEMIRALGIEFPTKPHLAGHGEDGCGAIARELQTAGKSFTVNSAVLYASGLTGSDLVAMRELKPEQVTEHYDGISALLRTLGACEVPTVAVLDGCVTGAGLGIGAHASACVVTERTRVSLPGPLHGFVTEGFASYQLARLPAPGLGAYLSLTGASLSGQEMFELGLATHTTESQAIHRIQAELQEQTSRHLGRTLRNVDQACMEPRLHRYDEGHALYYREQIAECFSETSLGAIIAKLQAGDSLWHAQAAHALSVSSPLAMTLTLEALNRAKDATCWTECLAMEASMSAKAVASADCAAGAAQLMEVKNEMLRAAKAEEVAQEKLIAYEEAMIPEEEMHELLGITAEEAAAAAAKADEAAVDAAMGVEEGASAILWEHGSLSEVSVGAYLA